MQTEPRQPDVVDSLGETNPRFGLLRTFLIVAAACLIAITIRLAAGFLVPVLIGLWITILSLPFTAWLRRRGLSRALALAVPVTLIALAAVVLVYFVVAWIADLDGKLPVYQERVAERRADFNATLIDHGLSIPEESVDQQISADAIVALATRILPSTLTVISGLGMAYLLFIFALIEADDAKRRLIGALGRGSPHLTRLREFVDVVARAIFLRAILGTATAIGDGILLTLLDVPHVGLWVVLSFFCSFVPYLGYWVAMIPPLLIALGIHGASGALAVFFGYWLINGFFDSVVGPRFQGNRLNLSPALTIVAVLFWGAVLGAVGGMLALPLTLGIKLLLLDSFPESRWLSRVIEAGAPPDPAPDQ